MKGQRGVLLDHYRRQLLARSMRMCLVCWQGLGLTASLGDAANRPTNVQRRV